MNKLMAIIDLFRKGSAVANPGAWKDATNLGLLLGALIMSLMTFLQTVCDVNLHMDLQTANSIGAGIGCLVAFIVNNISSRHAGILPAKPEPPYEVPVPPRSPVVPTWDDTPMANAGAAAPPPCVPLPHEDTKGLSNGDGVQAGDEAALQEALAALRRDRGRKQ